MKIRVAPLLVAAALLGASALVAVQWRRAARAEHALTENALCALGEAAELMQSLSLNLEKALVSRDGAFTSGLLGEISRDAGDVRRALSHLPLPEDALHPAMAFAQSLAARASSLLPQLVRQGSLSSPERTALKACLADCRLLAGQLSALRQEVFSGTMTLEQALHAMLPAEAPSPAAVRVRGLPAQEVSREEALAAAAALPQGSRVLSVEPGTDAAGAIPAWGATVRTEDLTLHVEITRAGGKPLLMSPETAGFAVVRTAEDCRLAAEEFLTRCGFPGMEAIWSQVWAEDGLCLLTFAALQDGVVIYPDRVSVQVRMDTAQVVGLEARSYWTNHTPRRLQTPALSRESAAARLAPELEQLSSRLCVIPADNEERLCWEFTVRREDERYLVYLDAQTGREAAVQKILMLEQGAAAA